MSLKNSVSGNIHLSSSPYKRWITPFLPYFTLFLFFFSIFLFFRFPSSSLSFSLFIYHHILKLPAAPFSILLFFLFLSFLIIFYPHSFFLSLFSFTFFHPLHLSFYIFCSCTILFPSASVIFSSFFLFSLPIRPISLLSIFFLFLFFLVLPFFLPLLFSLFIFILQLSLVLFPHPS